MQACCSEQFRHLAFHWPDIKAKDQAKQWVEENSCFGWRDGWLMVDGTLIPLYARPHHFGTSFYDRKSNYSMNVQIVNTPDLRIVDFAVGLPGSQHDATAWEATRLFQEHNHLLECGEFVWTDSAYPLRDWSQSPYKKPQADLPDNAQYNQHLSKVRIRSEHCMGFLKGRWSSLRGLRLRIDDEKMLTVASLWVITCIHLHCFAMEHEEGIDQDRDQFYRAGLTIIEAESKEDESGVGGNQDDVLNGNDELRKGKAKREELKRRLFRAMGA